MSRAAALTAAALALLLAAPAAALAQDCPQTSLGDIEDEVMCPICGTPLGLASEAPQAQQQRAFIEEQIADCRSKEEIKSALVAQFGEGVLALPGDESGEDDFSDVLVYLIPALGILLALSGIGFALLRWRGAAAAEQTAQPPGAQAASRNGQAPPGTKRLDDDLERYDL